MQHLQLPSSIEQVESLIISLYQPNPPEVISSTQATLTQLQAIPQAWQVAQLLLARPDEKVKFFGALTIIVKLNTESSRLGDDDATDLLTHLIDWYIASLSPGNGPLVARKLASALSTFLVHFHRLWPRFIQHLAFSLAAGNALPLASIDPSQDIKDALPRLGPAQTQAALWVVTNVVEDLPKVDLNAAHNMGFYQVVLDSAMDAILLIKLGTEHPPAVQEEAIKSLQAWIWFAQRASPRDSHIVESLRPLTTELIRTLPHQTSLDSSMELLTDVLMNYSAFFGEAQYQEFSELFQSQWADERYQAITQGDDDFESFRFGQLLLSYGDARLVQLMQGSAAASQQFLDKLAGLLSASGYPVVDNKLFVPAIEFWSTFAETLTDFTYTDEELADKSWVAPALSHVHQAISNAWQKIAYPPTDEFNDWDSTERVAYNDARKDVVDLLQSSFTVSGPPLVVTFADLSLSALNSSSWLQLEAAVFCLGGLADCIEDDARCDDALASVFNSSLFAILQTEAAQVPLRVRQTCVSFIEHYTGFFERHTGALPPALGLLFSVLGDPSIAAAASKSILKLCSSCRRHLHPDIDAFLGEYQKMASAQRLDCLSSERVIGAIGSVCQAIPDHNKQYAYCGKVLGLIREDVSLSITLSSAQDPQRLPCRNGSRCFDEATDESPSLHTALRVLKCLAGLAKGFGTPNFVPVDIDGADAKSTAPTGQLLELQRQIISIILDTQSNFGYNSEVVETICGILRSGFAETEPGPFVLPSADVAEYITRHGLQTPRVAVLISTACSFTSSLSSATSEVKKIILDPLLLWVIGIIQQLEDPESDPEVSQNAIEFVSRLVTSSPQSLLYSEQSGAVEFFFLFTLRVLEAKEPLPKAAAAEFWSVFLHLKGQDPDHQRAVDQAMETLGPHLAQCLARNIGGNASRSELDKLSEPLKKLVSRYPRAKDWLEAGLCHQSFPSTKVSADDKSMFVKKLVSLRGSRATNQVVREFWLSARGSNFAYAS